jgi:predicted GH43/DUF377 family glycosyl hydrolase
MRHFIMKNTIVFILIFLNAILYGQPIVSDDIMNQIYDEIKTPFKYGLVLTPNNKTEMVDSPSIFRNDGLWYMTYIVFDGKGYETWLAESKNLLEWKTLGRIMSFTENTWDSNQKAGYIALQDYEWGGSYHIQKFKNKYWMSYLGGKTVGYEAGRLGIGIAYTTDSISKVHEWVRLNHPVISSVDKEVRWYDNQTIYKSSIIWDKSKSLDYPFVMLYNAKGSNDTNAVAERIAMAVSDDMVNWKRFGDSPVIDHEEGISGDAFITKINETWVMFYFGAFWRPGAFDRFACSYDLKNWTIWKGEDLISPSEDYDNKYAHKPYVIKHDGIVYHFYCAVDEKGNRGIAVATSVDVGKSNLRF